MTIVWSVHCTCAGSINTIRSLKVEPYKSRSESINHVNRHSICGDRDSRMEISPKSDAEIYSIQSQFE